MTGKTAYTNARLLDPASRMDVKGTLIVENGKIADVGPHIETKSLANDIQIVNADGGCLAPGLVDIMVHTGEPGNEHKETFLTLGETAAAGGVTAIATMPDTHPIIDNVAGVAYIDRRARQSKSVKHFPYAAMTVQCKGKEMTELGLLAEAGAVGFTDGLRPVDDLKLMRRIMAYSRNFDLLLLQQPLHPGLAQGGMMNSGELCTRLGLPGIPEEAEPLQVMIDLRLAKATGARLHIGPVSMAESVQLIRAAKAKGLRVTCSTSPHYFTLTENDVGDYRTFTKIFPPLRDEENRKAIAEGVVDGTIDVITSNHHPQDIDAKRVPFAQAEPGIVGLETLLALSLKLYHDNKASLSHVISTMTNKPADILRLPLGRLTKGGAADFMIFDAEEPWRIENDRLRSKSKNSPYETLPVQGRVKHTILDGRHVFDGTKLAVAA
ncbi:MAG: dihydroorotase [Alphaproteobacteria bacterium]|nr:dihydroorotase [Alphaproteobacteria bacterium]